MRLLALSMAWLSGVAVALAWYVPVQAVGLFLIAVLCLALLTHLHRWRQSLPILTLVLALGMLRGGFDATLSLALQPWIGRGEITVEGIVAGVVERNDGSLRFRLGVNRIMAEGAWSDGEGDVLVTAIPSSELVRGRGEPFIRYGDLLRLTGELEAAPVFEGFDYRDYLARRGIQAVLYRPATSLVGEGRGSPLLSVVHRTRRALARSLERSLPEPQASLAQTLLLGMRENVPSELTQAFRQTGVSHLLAISGLHIGVVLVLGMSLAAIAFGRRRQLYLLLPLSLVWLYAVVSGLSPSVVRAAIMGSVYLAALALGRQRNVLPALGFAAALMVTHRPAIIYDLSFQLSFVAVAGILLLQEPTSRLLDQTVGRMLNTNAWPRLLRDWFIEGSALTMAAVLATFPLIAFNFGQVSLLSVPTTLLAVPALPLLLVSSFVASVAGLALPTLGQIAGWLAWLPLAYLVEIVQGLARIPNAVVHIGSFSGLLAWGYYGVAALIVAFAWIGKRRVLAWLGHSARKSSYSWERPPWYQTAGVFSLSIAVALLWFTNLSLPDDRLRVTFLDVGQGDAVLIRTPDGQQALVDGGPSPGVLARELGNGMPVWDRTLDLVVLSHGDQDHVAGLIEALRRYRVAVVLDSPVTRDTAAFAQWKTALAAEGAVVLPAQAGQIIRIGDDVTLDVLHPPLPLMEGTGSDPNNNSTVLRLRYGGFSLLLTGDLDAQGEAFLVDSRLDLDTAVLKVAHHGSESSSSQEFLDAVQPLVAVVSVGKGNRYGHPSPGVMQRLRHTLANSEYLFTTQEQGDITMITDGTSLIIEKQR